MTVYRTAARGNPVSTLIARYFGIANVGIGATATAEASPANAMTCVKPFTIPDKWQEIRQTPPWTGDDTYDAFDNKGVPCWRNPDVYIPRAISPDYTGYNQESNRGQPAGHPRSDRATTSRSASTIRSRWRKPVIEGGDPYRWNIANCNKTIYHWGIR